MTAHLRTLDTVDVVGKRVIVRVDLNVPMKGETVTDETRIRSSIPTLLELADKGANVVVLSHFGRPNGKVVAEYSLVRLRPLLEARTGRPVHFVSTDWTVAPLSSVTSADRAGEIMLMENTRFHPGEETNDPAFAQILADLGDIFVNDAFSVAHRAHASTEGIARLLPSFAGRSMQAELSALDRTLGTSARPVGAVIGGAKISSKLSILENIVKRVDVLFVGGAMANTFLHAGGIAVGSSFYEPGLRDLAEQISRQASASDCTIMLPRDGCVASKLAPGVPHKVVDIRSVPDSEMILDIGPDTVIDVARHFACLRTLLWNGPVGAFEVEPFHRGTFSLARIAARLTKEGALLSVAGGGDTLAALGAAGVTNDFSYVSTAGGAFLEWLEGRELPGVDILRAGAVREI